MWKYLIFSACGAGLGEVWQAIRIPFINAVLLFLLLTLFDRLSFPSLAWKFFGGVFVWLVAGFLLTRIINKEDRKSTRLNSSHQIISYAVFCLKKKKKR